ncbi:MULTISPECIES: hypothetical protein [Sphingobium]|uniref:hypothetical protein n=1 Tax=Sphingobium TaxID=165695 RepID=UPI0009F1DD92|nr:MULTISPECIES: hypothetical protein [Sphingobium]
MPHVSRILAAGLLVASWLFQPVAVVAQTATNRMVTYADIADLSFAAESVALVHIDSMIPIDPSRSPAKRTGYRRFYIEAETKALLVSKKPLGRSVRYLVDVPLDWHGRSEDLKGEEAFIFARRVPGKPGELQLVTPTAQLRWSASREARLRDLLTAAMSPDAPPHVTGVRTLLHVPGTLVGQGRTQIFLETNGSSTPAITVHRRPGHSPNWTVSFSELIADVGSPPASDTLEWYRLACSLPDQLPPGAHISSTPEARSTALADYRIVINSLGPCDRSLRFRPQIAANSFFPAA